MNKHESAGDDKAQIREQISGLSRMLGMIPSDDAVTITDPMTRTSMELSKWLRETRDSFLKLSVLIGKALDLNLQ